MAKINMPLANNPEVLHFPSKGSDAKTLGDDVSHSRTPGVNAGSPKTPSRGGGSRYLGSTLMLVLKKPTKNGDQYP